MTARSAAMARSSMMGRSGGSWIYILADLSLILFMVTAAALASADEPVKPAKAATVAGQQVQSPQAAPVALYRPAPGAPPLAQWLRDQSADARQQLTIVAQYRAGGQDAAMAQAASLAHDAGAAGVRARIVIEPGEGGTSAALAYDAVSAPQSK